MNLGWVKYLFMGSRPTEAERKQEVLIQWAHAASRTCVPEPSFDRLRSQDDRWEAWPRTDEEFITHPNIISKRTGGPFAFQTCLHTRPERRHPPLLKDAWEAPVPDIVIDDE